MQDPLFLVDGYRIAIRVDELQMFPTVFRRLPELPDSIITSVSSIDIRHFDLAEDITMTEGVGRGGQGRLGRRGGGYEV